MAVIRPSADLRNHYNEISKICHETKEPIYITKNGYNDLVLLSNEAYEELTTNHSKKFTKEELEKLYQDRFDKQLEAFEEYQKDILKSIEHALSQSENRIPLEQFQKDWEARHGNS